MLLFHPRVAVDEGTDDQAAFFEPLGEEDFFPEHQVSIDWETSPTAGSRVWTDVTPYVRGWGFRRGAEHELARISPGTLGMVLDNRDGRFDPDNTAGAYYPDVKPMRHIRLRLRWDSVTYVAFTGLIQDLPVSWPAAGFDSAVRINAVDAFSALSLLTISTDQAALTTDLGTVDSDITFTASGAGVDGNKLSVVYYQRPRGPNEQLVLHWASDQSLVVRDSAGYRTYPPLTLAVALEMVAGGEPQSEVVTSAGDLVAAVNEHSEVSQYMTASLPTGSSGEGTLQEMARVVLSGGTYDAEASGTRIHNVLDDAGWPAALRSIDDGNTVVAGASFSEDAEQSALDHLLNVDQTEGGRLYIDKEGRVRFEERHWRAEHRSSQVTLGEEPGELMPRDLTLSTEIDEIRNDITVTSAHSAQDVQVEDAESITDFFRRKMEVSLLTFSDKEAEAHANYLLYRYSQPGSRNDEVEVLAARDPILWPNVLGREISDLVTRRRRPLYGGTLESEQRIEAIRMDARPGELKVAWQLSPARDAFWILEDPVRGVLGQTTVPGW